MQSVSGANNRAPDCDSGCRGFKTRFSPHITKGILDGVVTGYYKDGSVQVVGHFSNGIKDGSVLYYYPNGSIK